MDLTCKIIQNIEKDMLRETERIKKARFDALRVTAFVFRRELQTGIRQGKLNLRPLSPYRNTQNDPRYGTTTTWKTTSGQKYVRNTGKNAWRHTKASSVNVDRPLWALGAGVMYKANRSGMTAELGFVEGFSKVEGLRRLAEKHLPGFRIAITDRARRFLHSSGIHLRKTTDSTQVPARDPVGQFYVMNARRMADAFENNFNAKMRGERI